MLNRKRGKNILLLMLILSSLCTPGCTKEKTKIAEESGEEIRIIKEPVTIKEETPQEKETIKEETTKEIEITKEAETTKEIETTKEAEATQEPETTKKPVTTKKPKTLKESEVMNEPEVTKEAETPKKAEATKEPETTQETQKITEHVHSKMEESTLADCENVGILKIICSSCGQVLQESVTEEAKGHCFEETILYEPNCREDGYKSVKCVRCGAVGEGDGRIEMLSHQYESELLCEGDCQTPQIIRHFCVMCDSEYETEDYEVVKEAHHFVTERCPYTIKKRMTGRRLTEVIVFAAERNSRIKREGRRGKKNGKNGESDCRGYPMGNKCLDARPNGAWENGIFP